MEKYGLMEEDFDPVSHNRCFFILSTAIKHNSGADFWQNCGFNDKSVKTSKKLYKTNELTEF